MKNDRPYPSVKRNLFNFKHQFLNQTILQFYENSKTQKPALTRLKIKIQWNDHNCIIADFWSMGKGLKKYVRILEESIENNPLDCEWIHCNSGGILDITETFEKMLNKLVTYWNKILSTSNDYWLYTG